jgi:TatD DNase family protein
VAIGEIGLDYYNGIIDHEKQKDVFRKQLELADKYNKPVIVHSRKATEDTINILKEFPNVKGSIHCFSGSVETANIYIKMGYKLGFNGVITFKNSNAFEVIEKLPLNVILLETDSPYLTPEPHRGTKNEPAYIEYVAKRICNIKGISMEKLSEITEKNVKDLFDI